MNTPEKPPALVSIVIIFLNEEVFLEEAIKSVFDQSYQQWELFLVDDGSTDGSEELAHRYAREFPEKIRRLEHKDHANQGMSASRNLGIRNSRGDYIAFLDADDIWLPSKLEQQVALMEAYPTAGMVCGTSEYWYSWTGNDKDKSRDRRRPVGAPANTLVPPPLLLKKLYPLGRGVPPGPSNFLLRRETIERVKGFEEQFRGPNQMYEDQGFLTKVHLSTPVYVSDACWDRHRIHPESCVATVAGSGKYHSVRQFYLKWLAEYLVKEKLEDDDIWKLYRRQLWRYRYPNLHWLISRPREISKSLVKVAIPGEAYDWLRDKKIKILERSHAKP